MSRGNRRGAIYHDDVDRRAWLKILALVCERHRCIVHGFCQMTNHYHLLIETADANLALSIGQLNGRYARYVNWRHDLVGHLFQGRYKAILVQKESYLLQLSRYIALNPLRGKIVASLDDWPWSSYPCFIGAARSPTWLDRNWLLGQFGSTGTEASARYREFVLAGVGGTSPLKATRHQVLLGDDAFVSQYRQLERSDQLDEAVKNARGAVLLSLLDFQAKYADRNDAMARAYLSTAFTMPQIAAAFGVSTKTVSRAVAAHESRPDE
jgi:REP element-mobilizing transposase RayT